MSPVLPPDLTIVLIGKSGVGKSASGNTILGRPAFESKADFDPVTTEISEQTGNVFGKQISVVDTPGILESKATEEEIKNFCQGLLQSSRRCLFLVVIRVGRFTKEDQKAVRAAERVLGPRGMEKSYLLFTGGDVLQGKTVEDFIFKDKDKDKEEGMLPKVVRKFAGAYHLFDNDKDDEEQVRELLLKSGHLRTQDHPDSTADDSKNRRVVLLGLPGAGKSSSGNTILRSEMFKSGCNFDPVSAETVSKSAIVEGREVTVVDTPGITDKVLTGERLFEEIMKSVVEASPGPHAFVIVVRLGRITEADIKLFEMLKELFSRDALKYSMVLFTHGDELGGQSIDDLIRSNRHVSDLVSMCGGRFCVFDNKTKRSREQVRDFLSKVDEMVSANGGEHYTDEMFKMAVTFLKEEERRNLSGGKSQNPLSPDFVPTIFPYLSSPNKRKRVNQMTRFKQTQELKRKRAVSLDRRETGKEEGVEMDKDDRQEFDREDGRELDEEDGQEIDRGDEEGLGGEDVHVLDGEEDGQEIDREEPGLETSSDAGLALGRSCGNASCEATVKQLNEECIR